MSSQNPSLSHGNGFTQYSILENDNFTLAGKTTRTSIDNAVQLRDASSQEGSILEQHVFSLEIACNEIDLLAKSLGLSQEIAVHAKSSYTQVYNYSDFDEHGFQHDTLIAACVYIACREKNQPRTMPEVFKSTHATIQKMLTECETLKAFLAVPASLFRPSKANTHLYFAYREIDTLSNSNGIPLHASNHAKRLYNRIRCSESFKDQDHRLVGASCLLIACHQLNLPQIFAIDTGIFKDHIARILKLLEPSYAAEKDQKAEAKLEIHESVTSTAADPLSMNRTVHTIQKMIEHLDLESDPSTYTQQNANLRASFEPIAPTPTSIATSVDDDAKTGISTAPDAPFTVEKAYPGSDNDSIIITCPPTRLATTAGRKNARAMRNTLYDVICCQCKRIVNLQNVHYTFQCASCKHKRCDNCTLKAIEGT